MTLAKHFETSFVVTAQKILQDQYIRDFEFVYSVKGKQNFPCLNMYDPKKIPYETAAGDPDVACSNGNCVREEIADGKKKPVVCEFKPVLDQFSVTSKGTEHERVAEPAGPSCHYYVQKYRALLASHAAFNYASYFQTMLFTQGSARELLRRRCLVADEAHEIEEQIIGFIGYDILKSYLDELKTGFEKFETGSVEGVAAMLEFLADGFTQMADELEAADWEDPRIARYKRRVQRMDLTWKEMRGSPENFVIQPGTDPFTGKPVVSVKPIEIAKYTRQFFDMPLQMFLSATINRRMFCETMGFDESECAFIEVERSPFDIRNRRVDFLNVASLNYKSTESDYGAVYAKANEIIEKHPDQKGLVLVTTKKHCSDLIASSPGSPASASKAGRLVAVYNSQTEGKQRDALLERHRKSETADVLVSPSLWYGVDLKDDLSRFQIILKTPYPSFADRRTRIKARRNPVWYKYAALVKLLQGLGRSVSNSADHAVTYCLDPSALLLIQQMRPYVPKAYHDVLGWP